MPELLDPPAVDRYTLDDRAMSTHRDSTPYDHANPERPFVDRRNYEGGGEQPVRERRQFSNSHDGLSPEARELALAIDEYKLRHRRRFITYEEMLKVMQELGYHK